MASDEADILFAVEDAFVYFTPHLIPQLFAEFILGNKFIRLCSMNISIQFSGF